MKVAGLVRNLPIVQISDDLKIASFVLLGDAELAEASAEALSPLLPPADYIVTAEAKGIPLAQELCHVLKMKRFFTARKSIKPYMADPFSIEVLSITTQKKQILCLDGCEREAIRGKRIILADDVISTGESLKALEELTEKAGGIVVARAAILAEGAAAERDDIIYLEKLPLFPIQKFR